MKPCTSPFKRLFYNPNRRVKSGKKYENAINWYLALLKKKEIRGQTKWIDKTMVKCQSRIKLLGISPKQIQKVFERRGVTNLLP